MGLAYFPRLSPFLLPLVSFQVYLYLLISVSTHFLTPADSQITPTPPPLFIPIAVSDPAYARSVNKLYVIGGTSYVHSSWTPVNQAMALDLAISWNSISPAWIKLKDGPTLTASTAAFSSDEQSLYTFNVLNTNSPWIYNVQNDTWRESTALKFESTAYNGITAVTDPRTGLIFLAGGYEAANMNSPYMKFMDVVDPISQTSRTIDLPDPQTDFSYRSYYGSVWSKYRSSIIYWGGVNNLSLVPAPAQNSVTEFVTDTLKWSTMIIGPGPVPPGRRDHCMTINEDGTNIVVYGGNLLNGTTVGEVWMLNLNTSTWSQGLTGPPRENVACTVAGDYLLIWGGLSSDGTMTSTDMLIYNLNASSYENQYTPPAYYKSLKPPPPLTRTTTPWDTGEWPKPSTVWHKLDPLSVSIGAIAAGVTAGLLLMGAMAGTFLIRRRRTLRQPVDINGPKGANTHWGFSGLLGHGEGRGGRSGFGKWTKKVPDESNEEDELERTLQELVDQEMQIVQKRQMLVLQHQESKPRLLTDQKRGPSAVVGDKEEIFPLPPPRLSPGHVHSTSYSPESLNDRRTVQAVPGPIDMYQRESYADDGPRRESELVQDVIEPLYGPSPTICNSIPDLVFEPSPDVGMDWTKQQQSNHPHAVVDPSGFVIQH